MLTLALALWGGSAYAATGHRFLSSIGEAPAGTPLSEPQALAVDHASGELFVADPPKGVVDVFNSSGAYATQFGEGIEVVGIAVDEANGDVYVAEPGGVEAFEPNGSGGYELFSEWSGEGTPGREFEEVTGVAIDNSTKPGDPSAGDVYVLDAEDVLTEAGAVDVFRPSNPEEAKEGDLAKEGQFVRALSAHKSSERLEEPNGVSVSAASGEVYVADSVKGEVFAYSDAGTLEAKFSGAGSPSGTFLGKEKDEEGNVTAVAVDEGSGDVLVAEAERHVVGELTSGGEWAGSVSGPSGSSFAEPRGVAVAASADLYVADPLAHVVDVFGPGVTVPDVVTGAASKPTRTSVTLSGTIDGDGKPAHYHFEWGTSEAYGSSTPSTASGSGEEAASATLSELKAGATYYYRLVGENENGANVGLGREFTTAPAVAGVSTGAAQSLAPTSATLSGSLTPGGVDAHYYFEWGLTSEYGNDSPAPPGTDAGEGQGAVAAHTELTGLQPNTTYHYRIVASNSFGSTTGEDAKLTTSGPPRITSEAAVGISHEGATIRAQINPDELATTYHFEWGETGAYGHEAPLGGESIPAGDTPVAKSAVLSNLKPGVTYHYRVVASNQAGTTDEPDQIFTAVPPALIDSESVAQVSSNAAVLQGEINPLELPTTYYFQYGTENCKERPADCTDLPTPPASIGSGNSDQAVSVALSELQPATTYHYRVLASNTLGVAEGTLHTFTTPPAQASFALPDGRAWEMVSPPDKHGAPIEALTREGGLILAAESGDRLTYVADGTITEEAQGNRAPEVQQVIATRGEHEWSSQDIATPQSRAQGVAAGDAPEYQFFTPDLSLSLVEPVGAEPPLAPETQGTTMYVRDSETGSYVPVVNESNVAPGTAYSGQIHFVNATTDLSRVVIQSKVALEGPSSGPGLYEWNAGRLQFASVLPSGLPAPKSELGFPGVPAHAISKDGTRLVWTVPDEGHKGHLYMRDIAGGVTIQLDAAQGIAEPITGSAQFQTASEDGSRVFFTDKQRLTADSTAEAPQGTGKPDLYECEIVEEEAGKPTCHLTDLTVAANAGEHAAVQGLLFGASEDGSEVYFVAEGVLAANENGNGEHAEANAFNLYALSLSSGGGFSRVFIARLSSEDGAEWKGGSTIQGGKKSRHRVPHRSRLPGRALPGVHVRGEPHRL